MLHRRRVVASVSLILLSSIPVLQVLNPKVAGAVMIISVGMVFCVNGELNAELLGIFLVLLGGLAEALRLVGAKGCL